MIHVGVLSPMTGGFFFGEALDGIVREVASVGGHVTLVQTLDAGRQWDDFRQSGTQVDPVGWQDIDGFIAITWSVAENDVRRAQDAGKPIVLAASCLEGVDVSNVVCDNAGGVHASVDHLIEHGHTRIGFVGNTAQSDVGSRHLAYQAAMASHGLAEQPVLCGSFDAGFGGDAVAERLAAMPPGERCTALIGGTDRTALDLLVGLQNRGIRVPEDVAIVGFDDIEATWFSTPQLTTVHQDFKEIGARAAALLLRELADPGLGAQHVVLPTELVCRTSCGCPSQAVESTDAITDAANALERELCAQVSAAHDEGGTPEAEAAAMRSIDKTIRRGLDRLLRDDPSPTAMIGFAQVALRCFAESVNQSREWGVSALAEHAVATLLSTLTRAQGSGYLDRIAWLSTSLAKQHSVSMGLLGDVDEDPADLDWLGPVGVSAGCLGVWSGAPSEQNLEIAGTYDPENVFATLVGATMPIEQFPPRALLDLADAGKRQVTYVIPVRGSTGDHGLLAVVAGLESEFTIERGTYDYWAALLGAALREKRMLADVRRSERRYELAARAANDGMWEHDVATDETYLSDRCAELLDAPPGTGKITEMLMAGVHPDDRPRLEEALAMVEERADVPVQIEYRRVRPDGSIRWVLTRALGVAGPDGRVTATVGSVSDVDRRRALEDQLRHAALYDTVTGLPNRRLFLERLTWAVAQARRGDDARFVVVFLDLDGFKLINDSLGHLMGDLLLQSVGERLRSDLRDVDTAARFGGDEFAILLFGLKHDAVLTIVERLQEQIAEPVLLGEHEVSVTASVGIATSDTGYADAEDVLRDADIAMYHAKETERGTACVFDPVMRTRATQRLRAQSELRTALVEEQFVMHYQPVVALDGSRLAHFEALVRWEHPTRGLLLPRDFLPAMAESGTIIVLGQWIIDTVCEQIAAWRKTYDGQVTVAVNLSHREFWSDQLLLTVTQALSRHDIPPSCLILEITESVIMSDPESARQIMADLHASGIRMHVDDFGTGQSSLHTLRAFPVDALKIDRSFVHQIDVDIQTTELVRLIVGIGQTLGLDIVAEGVETSEQAASLRTAGCGSAQGWLYARALPGREAGRLLGTRLSEVPVPDELAVRDSSS